MLLRNSYLNIILCMCIVYSVYIRHLVQGYSWVLSPFSEVLWLKLENCFSGILLNQENYFFFIILRDTENCFTSLLLDLENYFFSILSDLENCFSIHYTLEPGELFLQYIVRPGELFLQYIVGPGAEFWKTWDFLSPDTGVVWNTSARIGLIHSPSLHLKHNLENF